MDTKRSLLIFFMILAKKYEILEKIGGGRFGFVYKGIQTKTKVVVAVKVESSSTTHLLKNETTFLKYLYEQGVRTIPTVYWYGVVQQHNFLVMTYYDCSLYDLYQTQTEKVSISQSMRYMKQAISILESIHGKHVLHRDIKPHNFMVRGDDLFLIDFGLATFWISGEQGEPGIVGTPKYTSYFLHKGDSFSRKDDLISLGYVFLEWIGGENSLPWNCCGGAPRKNEDYIFLKSWERVGTVCRETSQEGHTFLNCCYEWKWDERPNYSRLKDIFI